MKRTFKVLFAMFSIFVITYSQAQTQGTAYLVPTPTSAHTKDEFSISPTTGSLGIFGQVPVGNYTGTAQIGIPIYDLKYKELSVPINIMYQTSGIKADIFPGPVGLGWAIQAGGMITRTINGEPDTKEYLDVVNGTIQLGQNSREQNDWYDVKKQNGLLMQNNEIVFPGEAVDPDEFQYNINGQTGKFYSNYNGTFQVQSDQGDFFYVTMNKRKDHKFTFPSIERITFPNGQLLNNANKTVLNNIYGNYLNCYAPEYNYNQTIEINCFINGFTMIDSKGIKYIFGNTDETNSQDNSIEFTRLGQNSYMTDYKPCIQAMSWHLTSIESPNGYKIDFKYDTEIYVTKTRFSDLALYQISNQSVKMSDKARLEDAFLTTLINGSCLKEITFPTGKVIFSNSIANNQLDYPVKGNLSTGTYNDNRLLNRFYGYPDIAFANTEKIVFEFDNNVDVVRNRFFPHKIDKIEVYDSNSTLRRNIQFNYTKIKNTRLKLMSLDILGNNTDKQTYNFEYNSKQLPPYLAGMTDHYGFFNGVELFPLDLNITSKVTNDPNYIDWMKRPIFYYAESEILNKIIYPTRGYTEFKYEKHLYGSIYNTWPFTTIPNSYPDREAGGIRIQSVKNYDKDGSLIDSKEYYYTKKVNDIEVSSGVLAYKPQYIESYTGGKIITRSASSSISNNGNGFYEGTINSSINIPYFFRFSTNPISPMSATRGSHITYSEVKVVEKGNGMTIYKYKNYDNGYADKDLLGYVTNEFTYNNEPFSRCKYWEKEEGISMSIERGQLLSEETYDNGGKLSKLIKYVYNDDNNRFNENVRYIRKKNNDVSLTGYTSQLLVSGLHYTYFPYLKEKTETNIIGDDSIVQKQTFTYDTNYRLLKSNTIENSNKNKLSTEYNYPSDQKTTNLLFEKMTDNYMLSYPIESIQKNNGNITTRKVYSFSDGIALDNPSLILPYQNLFQFKNNSLFVEETIMKYDSYGNPLNIINRSGNSITYFWSYYGQYPIAKIEGLNYDDVVKELPVDFIKTLSTTFIPTAEQLNTIRTALTSKNAFITTYTYIPLIGMSSKTDPRGVTTYFKYNDFGKLENIKDFNENVIQQYQYHYSIQK